MIFYNPYEKVNFENINKYKSALHTHIRTEETHPETWEESWGTIEDVLNAHINTGFDIYARTEKNDIKVPENENLKIIPAYERTNDVTEHSIVLFVEGDFSTDYSFSDNNNEIQFRAHPHDPGREKYKVEEMVGHLDNYTSMIGLEIISRNYLEQVDKSNQEHGYGESHPHRRGKGQYIRTGKILRDIIIDYQVPNVWLLGVSDSYNDHVTRNYEGYDTWEDIYNSSWADILADSLDDEDIKNSLKNGSFFFISHNDTESGIPEITDIKITNNEIQLNIDNDYNNVYWFYDNEVVATGDNYDLTEKEKGQEYVRFEVWTKESDYWPEKNILNAEDEFDTNFYDSNIVGSNPFYLEGFNKGRKIFHRLQKHYYGY